MIYIKKNTKLEKLTKISNSNRFKSNKDMNQVFIYYKTFIKGKPYSELSKEYKQGIEIGEGVSEKLEQLFIKKQGNYVQ